MLKNHGYCRCLENGQETALISCQEGVFQFFPPESANEPWKIHSLLDTPASDAVLIDLDGDGQKELCVISPFHGEKISIYANKDSQYKKVYDYPEAAEFSHAICACTLCGTPAFVFGHRKANAISLPSPGIKLQALIKKLCWMQTATCKCVLLPKKSERHPHFDQQRN